MDVAAAVLVQTEGNNQTINWAHSEYLAGKAAPVLDRKGNASRLKQAEQEAFKLQFKSKSQLDLQVRE